MLSLNELKQALETAYKKVTNEVPSKTKNRDEMISMEAMKTFKMGIGPDLVINGNREDIKAYENFFATLDLDKETQTRISRFLADFPEEVRARNKNFSGVVLLNFVKGVDALSKLLQNDNQELPAQNLAIEILLSPLSSDFVIERLDSQDFDSFRKIVTNFFIARDEYEKILKKYETEKVSEINIDDSSKKLLESFTKLRSFFPHNSEEAFSTLRVPNLDPGMIDRLLLQKNVFKFLEKELNDPVSVLTGLNNLDLYDKEKRPEYFIDKNGNGQLKHMINFYINQEKKSNVQIDTLLPESKGVGFVDQIKSVLGDKLQSSDGLFELLKILKFSVDKAKGLDLDNIRNSMKEFVQQAETMKSKSEAVVKERYAEWVISDLYNALYAKIVENKESISGVVLSRNDEKYVSELEGLVNKFLEGQHHDGITVSKNAENYSTLVMFSDQFSGKDTNRNVNLEKQSLVAGMAAKLYTQTIPVKYRTPMPERYRNTLLTRLSEATRKELTAIWNTLESEKESKYKQINIAKIVMVAAELSKALSIEGGPTAGVAFILRAPKPSLSGLPRPSIPEHEINVFEKKTNDLINAIEIVKKKSNDFLRNDPQLNPEYANVGKSEIKMSLKDLEAFKTLSELSSGAEAFISKTFNISSPETLMLQGQILFTLRQLRRTMEMDRSLATVVSVTGGKDFVQGVGLPDSDRLKNLINRLESPLSAKNLSEFLDSIVPKDKKPASSLDSKILEKGGFLERANKLVEAIEKQEVKERKNVITK